MPVSADTLRVLMEAGVTGDALLRVVENIDRDMADALPTVKPRSAAAIRQARYREKHKGVTRDVTGDASRDVTQAPTPKDPELFLEPSEDIKTPPPSKSSPAKPKTDWPKDPIDHWWPIYPRKVAKGDARKAIERTQRLGKVTFADLCEATKRFAANPGCDPQYVPYPASWLNDERWADEQLAQPLAAAPSSTLRLPFDCPSYKPIVERYRFDHSGSDPPTNGSAALLPAEWVQQSQIPMKWFQ